MEVISIVIGIINQLITGGAPPCMTGWFPEWCRNDGVLKWEGTPRSHPYFRLGFSLSKIIQLLGTPMTMETPNDEILTKLENSLVVWNIFSKYWESYSNWLSYFSAGLKPRKQITYNSPVNYDSIAYDSPINHHSVSYNSPINQLWITFISSIIQHYVKRITSP